MMAVRIDVVPGTNFPGLPFNGQRACFLMKNITNFDQTVKELHTRGKTQVTNFYWIRFRLYFVSRYIHCK